MPILIELPRHFQEKGEDREPRYHRRVRHKIITALARIDQGPMSKRQQDLFQPDPAPWEVDDADERLIATVVLSEPPHGPFDYAVPPSLCSAVAAGKRVRVPLGRGNRDVTAWCVQVEYGRVVARQLKEVQSVLDDEPLLSPSMLRLTEWISEHYLCPRGVVLEAVVPAGVRTAAGTRATAFLSVPTRVSARITQLKLPAKQLQALKILAASPEPLTAQQLAAAARCTLAPIHQLRDKGLIEIQMRRVQTTEVAERTEDPDSRRPLNRDQQQALDAIREVLNGGRHETLLLYGVTGSGKTEVYIRAIEELIQFGRQAIVLVPEISLTPQTRQRFRSRFERVAVLHSHLSDSERHWHWQRIARGEIQVVVGARSAVFAPTPQLGMIVLDEEHDASFKQDQVPRYHAREVALQRARAEGVPLVLGSATPSLESWYRAQQGEFRLLKLPVRVLDRPLPDVMTVDLRLEHQQRRSRGAISRQLQQAVDEALRDGGQVILLLNRRGYSTSIQCPSCGHVIRCRDCDIALTHHRADNLAVCHYCDYRIATPAICPECRFAGIRFAGQGTQRLEQELKERFPGVVALRMDSDTMQRPGSHEQALAAFRAGDVRILFGTQMIAKGLDFPNVTLVGVINADTALHFPDFRAAERTFQLVTQVAGRTGRGDRGGRVLVQTFSPEHPAIQAAIRHDYDTFAAQELPVRQQFQYPPAATMVRIIVRGPVETEAEEFADALTARLHAAKNATDAEVRILGPAPAPIAKLQGKFRFHSLLQSQNLPALHAIVRTATADLKPPGEVQWIVDVDPLNLL
jgi:primosomal protein N' (replication factor Y) (superfamily II helicase)